MKSFALFVAFMVLLTTVGGAFAYTYTESFADVSGPSEWTNLSRGFDVDYVSEGSVNYSVSGGNGSTDPYGNDLHRIIHVNSSIDGALSDFQVGNDSEPFLIEYDSDMQPDFDDIRMYYASNMTEIPYFLVDVVNSTNASGRMKLDVPAYGGVDVKMYYGNSSASSGGNGSATFPQWHGSATDSFVDSQILSIPFVYEAKVRRIGAGEVYFGVSNQQTPYTDDSSCLVVNTGDDLIYAYSRNEGAYSQDSVAPAWSDNTWTNIKIELRASNDVEYFFGDGTSNILTTNNPDESLGLVMYEISGSGENGFSFAREYTANPPTITIGEEQQASVQTTITPRPESGTNGTSISLTETNTSAVSTLNLGGLTILQNIENLFNNSATVDYANYTINYSTAHAVLRSPVNASSFYGSATLEWWTNPQGTSATYYVAEDPDFFTSVAQGTTTQVNSTLSLSPGVYYWKVGVGAVESDVWQFTIEDAPPVAGLFNFSVYDETTFTALSGFKVKIYNDTWYNEKTTSTGYVVFNSSEVVAGEYTALINASGYSPRWRIVESPANVSAYLPNTTKQIWLINFNLIDYTNLFSYSTSRLILTKPTADLGTITVSDSYFDASGSNPVYLIDYNNYILTLRNSAGYEKSVGSYLPIQDTQTSLVVGEINTLPDTEAHGGFVWNITKSNASIVLMWNAPEGSLTEAFQYNITNSTIGAVEYEINTIAPYGTATFYIPAGSDTVWLIQLSASTSDGAVYHKESYRPSQQMIDLELSDYWYNSYSMFLLLIMGLLFGYRNARTGAVVVSLSAAALAIMGLLHVPASVLAMAVTISIFSKMAEGKK